MIRNEQADNIPLGVTVIIGTVLMMALADAIIKFVSNELPLWQVFVIRSTLALPVLLLLLCRSRLSKFDVGLARWVALRSLMLTLMYIAIYAAAPVVALSVIAAALYTGPLFTTLFSGLINRERVPLVAWLGVMCGFIGVMLIIKPTTDEFRPAILIPMIAAILYALVAIITRSKCQNVRPVVLATALNICLVGVGLVATGMLAMAGHLISDHIHYPFLLGSWIEMGQREWATMAILAVLIILIGIGLAKAYQSAPSAIIATFDHSYLLFAALWGFVFFREVPDALSVIGMVMIAGAGFLATGIKPLRLSGKI